MSSIRRGRRGGRMVAFVTAVALGATACGDGGGTTAEPPPATAPLVEIPSTTMAPPTTARDRPAPLDEIDLALEPVASIAEPMAMAAVPDEDALVWIASRSGLLFLVDLTGTAPPEVVLDFSDDVGTDGEQGFLGLAVSPDGDRLYTSYSEENGATRLDEYQLDGPAPDEGSRRQVFGHPQPYNNHNGGGLAFGPDGLLYLGLGDGGSAGDPDENGQDTTTLLGSIMRIEPTAQGDCSYGVPRSNPFTDDDGRPEIWAYGLRNPWRFSFDRATGDLWIGDVGQNRIEEIDHLPTDRGEPGGRAANLGWNLTEGTQEFAGPAAPDHVPPVFEYPHEDGNCSVTGGYVYRGEAIPDLTGAYLFGDYCVSDLRGLRLGDDGELAEARSFGVRVEPGTLVSFGEDAAGELYVLSAAGEVSRIVAG